MSREEAIEKLESMRQKVDEETYRALILAIKALENHDTFMKYAYSLGKHDALSQEPCEDAISRRAVLELVADYDLSRGQVFNGIHELPPVTPSRHEHDCSTCIYQDERDSGECYECVKGIQDWYKQEPSRRKGHWIDYSDEGFVECPFCGHATTCEDNIDELHYCFYCGARMVEPKESEEQTE